ncbi:MAG: hypothetical protein LUG50_02885 [Planctomycetaceae bacterium]|nr:hypothetical protein [Planctomycetaceae bacterium]
MRLQNVLLTAVVAVMLWCSAAAAGQQQLAHAIFVKVNGQTITQEQVVEVVQYIVKREFNGVIPEDEEVLDNLQDAALRDLVRCLLIHDEARRVGVRPRGNEKFLMQRAGLKQEEVTPILRKLLVADDMFEDIMMASGTPLRDPSPREIRDFYEENREEFRPNAFIIVRTIFLPITDREPQAYLKAQGEELLRQIAAVPMPQRNEAFGRLAVERSQDIFARYGGLLTADAEDPYIPKNFSNQNPDGSPIFPPIMVEEIRKLNRPGEGRLAVSAEGVHLLYCDDVQGGQEMSRQEAYRIAEFILKERDRNARLRQWLNEVYDRSDVRWHDGTDFDKDLLTKILLPSEVGPQS